MTRLADELAQSQLNVQLLEEKLRKADAELADAAKLNASVKDYETTLQVG